MTMLLNVFDKNHLLNEINYTEDINTVLILNLPKEPLLYQVKKKYNADLNHAVSERALIKKNKKKQLHTHASKQNSRNEFISVWFAYLF